MTTQFLPVIHDNAHLTLIESLTDLEKKEISQSELNIICGEYRVKATCSLLMAVDISSFYTSLTKSGQCFLYGIKKISENKRVTSKFTPFLDAVAAQDFKTANEIATCSSDQFNASYEYEEDFLYYKFIMSCLGNKDGVTGDVWLKQYEALDDSDVRYKACLALWKKDVEMLDLALQDLVIQFEDKYKLKLESGSIGEEYYYSEGQVFIEGIALIVIAEKMGIKIKNKYKYIPDIVIAKNINLPIAVDWRLP